MWLAGRAGTLMTLTSQSSKAAKRVCSLAAQLRPRGRAARAARAGEKRRTEHMRQQQAFTIIHCTLEAAELAVMP